MTEHVEPEQDFFAPPEQPTPEKTDEVAQVPEEAQVELLTLNLPTETARALRDSFIAVADGKTVVLRLT